MKRATTLLLLIALTGCMQADPYLREGTWRPSGANDADLRAMVAVPSDLVAARPAAPADGALAAAALERLRHDRVRPLPDSGLAQVVLAGGAAAAPPTATPAAGAGN